MTKPSKTPTQEAPQAEGRICAYIPLNGFIEGRGYRVSIVEEGVAGHTPTGTWPYEGKPGQQLPWFWGDDYEQAKRLADEYNARLGLTPQDALDIVTSSMAAQSRRGRRRAGV